MRARAWDSALVSLVRAGFERRSAFLPGYLGFRAAGGERKLDLRDLRDRRGERGGRKKSEKKCPR